ncbi:MAG: fibronectin type III domain-containing protein [Candidatus Eisenbacteria bacterium]
MRFSTETMLGWIALFVLTASAVTCATADAATWNSVTLTWTAPGDDGGTGRAAQYDIRYSTSTISGTDTTTWWNQASQCAGEPVPQSAGASESFAAGGLQPSTTYYFMIKTADEVPNWSGFSNVATKATTAAPDTIPPSPVRNLASATGPENAAGSVTNMDCGFFLASTEAFASVSSETRGRVSRGPACPDGPTGWPVAFLEPLSRLRFDGGLV